MVLVWFFDEVEVDESGSVSDVFVFLCLMLDVVGV